MITASGDEQSGLKLETSALAEFAFDRAPFGISLTSARPATYGRYVLANPAYCAITDTTRPPCRLAIFATSYMPTTSPR